jgi:hypothetical protein
MGWYDNQIGQYLQSGAKYNAPDFSAPFSQLSQYGANLNKEQMDRDKMAQEAKYQNGMLANSVAQTDISRGQLGVQQGDLKLRKDKSPFEISNLQAEIANRIAQTKHISVEEAQNLMKINNEHEYQQGQTGIGWANVGVNQQNANTAHDSLTKAEYMPMFGYDGSMATLEKHSGSVNSISGINGKGTAISNEEFKAWKAAHKNDPTYPSELASLIKNGRGAVPQGMNQSDPLGLGFKQ